MLFATEKIETDIFLKFLTGGINVWILRRCGSEINFSLWSLQNGARITKFSRIHSGFYLSENINKLRKLLRIRGSKNCSKHSEKVCMYSLINFKNFLFLVIFAISLLLSKKNSQYPRKYHSIFDWSNWGDAQWAESLKRWPLIQFSCYCTKYMFFRVFKVADEEFETQIGKKWLTKNDGSYKKIWIFFLRFFWFYLKLLFVNLKSAIWKIKRYTIKCGSFFL